MGFIVRKNDIKEFPFSECAKLNDGDLEIWAVDRGISSFNTWMLPQLQAYFSTFKCTKDEETGLFSPKRLFLDNISGNDWTLGIWRICTKLKRSALVKSQINPVYSEYSALVPLILSGLKKTRKIGYEQWDKEGIQHLMNADLYEAATFKYDDSLGSDRLLELRHMGLTTKTGPKAGTAKKATSCWCLTGLQHTEVAEYPKLTMTMLSQIWVAHPSIRNSLMILDPHDWDRVPEPLVANEVLVNKVVHTTNPAEDVPW